MIPRVFWHYGGAIYLALQSLGAVLWWLVLWVYPPSRAYFRPSNAPDAVLLAFALPDFLLFIGAALWAAIWLFKRPDKAILPLALHVGAAVYAALFCLLQWILTGEAVLAAILMAPSLFVGPLMLWMLSRR
ncbi:MAG TPA: hypothetical protein VGB45_16460 [Abditibacterium sp.]|jgi:hypothetical protein